MRAWALVVILVACAPTRERPTAPALAVALVASPPASAPVAVVGEPIDPKTPVTFGRLAAIQLAGERAVSIDEAGAARVANSPLFDKPGDGLAFSQPVEEVVFVRHVATENRPGAPAGVVYCARTRAGTLECLTEYPAAAYRFAFPATRVTRVAVASELRESVVCVAAATPACWLFSHDGKRAERYAMDETRAMAIAAMLPAIAPAWLDAEPQLSIAHTRKVVVSDGDDRARTRCALLDGGVLTCYGPGVHGELGDGALATTPRASRPLHDVRVIDVATSGRYVCAVVEDGRLACWGELPDDLAVARRTKPTPLAMCPLDRAASAAQFERTRQRTIADATACSQRCKATPHLDCELGCEPHCITPSYLFGHASHCQEPLVPDQRCVDHRNQPVRWLSDAELRELTPPVELTLAPVFVRGITDARSVAVYGQHVCVVRRGGALYCL